MWGKEIRLIFRVSWSTEFPLNMISELRKKDSTFIAMRREADTFSRSWGKWEGKRNKQSPQTPYLHQVSRNIKTLIQTLGNVHTHQAQPIPMGTVATDGSSATTWLEGTMVDMAGAWTPLVHPLHIKTLWLWKYPASVWDMNETIRNLLVTQISI